MEELKEKLTEVRSKAKHECDALKLGHVLHTALEVILEDFDKTILPIPACIAYTNKQLSLVYWMGNVEFFVDNIMPNITKTFGCKWKFSVDSTSIDHVTTIKNFPGFDDYIVDLKFYSNQSEHCRIIKKSTGVFRKVSKNIEVEEEVIEYFVNCDDRDLGAPRNE